jgi:GTP-binding protein Era
MPPNEQPSVFRSGFVALMGRTNVGKSTLINAILKQKITAISHRPQTTRQRQLGILQREDAQVIFIDTPGLHKPTHKLGEYMVREAESVLGESDLILFVVDISNPPNRTDQVLAEKIQALGLGNTTILVLNKIDLVSGTTIADQRKSYHALVPEAEVIEISSLRQDSVEKLIEMIVTHLPEGPAYYPADQVTDTFERDIAADLVRASALNNLRDEIPHGIAIRIDQYRERGTHGAYIEATLFVERENHKAIVIGSKGSMLKKIGSEARKEIESMSGRKVFLKLRVKVRKNWRNDKNALNRFGFRQD